MRKRNSRVMFADLNGDETVDGMEILQENHYYPFGMNMEGGWNAGTNQYQYNGKEIDNDFGIDWYHYGARMFDPAVGRFTGVDPLAADYAAWSTYSYVFDNPLSFIDPDGRSGESVTNEYTRDLKTGTVTQISTVGGDEVDIVYSGGANEDGSFTVTSQEVLDVEQVEKELSETSIRLPGVVSTGTGDPGATEVEGADDPIFILLTMGSSGAIGAADDVAVLGFAKVPRVRSSKLRRLWEKATGKKWPKEPKTPGRNQSVSHKKALEDGGTNDVSNLEPMPWKDHHKMHKDKGDFSRWGKKAAAKRKKKNDPD